MTITVFGRRNRNMDAPAIRSGWSGSCRGTRSTSMAALKRGVMV